MKKPVFSSIFQFVIKPVISAEKDKYLAIASLEQVKKYLPNIDTETNFDLLPIAFNACVVNRINLNGDVIDTPTALALYKTFINKPINIEHERQKVVGTILTAGFSEFGTDRPLTLDEVKDRTSPFNITVGGVLWRIVNDGVASYIEETGDPTSPNYEKISASWELGFSIFEIVLMDTIDKNLENGKIISDASQIEELKPNLKAYGGEGKIDNKFVYRKPAKEGCIAIGIGLTESPAAEVKGIATGNAAAVKLEVTDEVTKDIEAKKTETPPSQQNNTEIISQPNEPAVKDSSIIMKITNLADITDENLKVMKASSVMDFIQEQVKEADKKYLSELAEKNKLAETQKATAQDLENTKAELKKIQDTLAQLQKANDEREKQETFNARMTALDSVYELSADDRKIIASLIKEMTAESFAEYEKQAAVLMKEKSKEFKKAAAAQTALASATPTTPPADATTVITDAVDKSKLVTPTVPATPSTATPTLKEKFAKAFAPENFLFKP